tara:strand:+ start:191 stop:433 length:243 start_codon:yes stop_codon:yes gene_type:complete
MKYTQYKLSPKGKRSLSKKDSYKEWVTEDANFFFSDVKSIWCDVVTSGIDGRILDRDVHKSVDSFLVKVENPSPLDQPSV